VDKDFLGFVNFAEGFLPGFDTADKGFFNV